MAKNTAPKVKRELPYRFVCEHCGIQTEWKYASVAGDTEAAIDETVLPKAMQAAQGGNYFDLNNITGKCASCGHRQSWELGEAKAWIRQSPLMGLGISSMVGGVGALIAVLFFGLLGALIIFIAVSLLVMIGVFIYGVIQYFIIKSEMKKTAYRYIPEIVWHPQQIQAEPVLETCPVMSVEEPYRY